MAEDSFTGAAEGVAADAASTAQDVGNAAAEKLNSKRAAAAGIAQGAADKLSSTAEYIRRHDTSAMVDDVKALVKKNPMPAILGAAALGFIIAKAFSSRD